MTADGMLYFKARFWWYAGFHHVSAGNFPNYAGKKEWFKVLLIMQCGKVCGVVKQREAYLAAYLNLLYACRSKITCSECEKVRDWLLCFIWNLHLPVLQPNNRSEFIQLYKNICPVARKKNQNETTILLSFLITLPYKTKNKKPYALGTALTKL